MADCFDTDGTYECVCQRDFVGDGRDCQKALCSLCETIADCSGSSCSCPTGYSGNGFACDSQSKAVIPVSKTPAVSVRTGLCIDPFWLQIAKSRQNVLILEKYDLPALPCMKHLRHHLVDVFATVFIDHERLNTDGIDFVRAEIQKILDDFRGTINGIHFDTDDRMLFSRPEWAKIFDVVRTAQLQISVEGYGNLWDLRIANEVDQVVIFQGMV